MRAKYVTSDSNKTKMVYQISLSLQNQIGNLLEKLENDVPEVRISVEETNLEAAYLKIVQQE